MLIQQQEIDVDAIKQTVIELNSKDSTAITLVVFGNGNLPVTPVWSLNDGTIARGQTYTIIGGTNTIDGNPYEFDFVSFDKLAIGQPTTTGLKLKIFYHNN